MSLVRISCIEINTGVFQQLLRVKFHNDFVKWAKGFYVVLKYNMCSLI